MPANCNYYNVLKWNNYINLIILKIVNAIEKSSSNLGQNVILNFGPQHPAAHGVLRLILELDGEVNNLFLNIKDLFKINFFLFKK